MRSGTASFRLKVKLKLGVTLQVTEAFNKPIRLEFSIIYTLKLPLGENAGTSSVDRFTKVRTVTMTENIQSRPFTVCSNIRKSPKRKWILFSITLQKNLR